MARSLPARTWPITTLAGGVLALIGFSVPWFFATGVQAGDFSVNGWRLFLAVPSAMQDGSFFSPGFLLIFLLLLGVLVGAAIILVVGFQDVVGKLTTRQVRLQIGAASVGMFLMLLSVGAFALLFRGLANLDNPDPTAVLIPGVGVLLMFVGFGVALVAGVRSRQRARKKAEAAAS